MNLINLIDRTVKKHLVYREESKDSWNSYAKEILEAQKSNKILRQYADCDDFAMTAVELALAAGIPKERLGRAIVWCYPTLDGPREGHMTALYRSTDGQMWYFGDTFGRPCKIQDRSHDLTMVNWLADNRKWRRISDR